MNIIDPNSITVSGEGLDRVPINTESAFSIHTSDVNISSIDVLITGKCHGDGTGATMWEITCYVGKLLVLWGNRLEVICGIQFSFIVQTMQRKSNFLFQFINYFFHHF